MFQVKNWTSIVAGMLNQVRGVQSEVTDFNVGAKARTMLEAPAIEIEEAYQQAFNGIKEAIPVATYQSFNFDRLDAAPATGIIHVTVGVTAADVVIPAGTLFTTPTARTGYLSQDVIVILAGASTGDVSVVAVDAGVVGNLPVSSAFTASPQIANFVSAANPILFNNGRDLEQEDERKQRFVSYVQTLQRCSIAALKYGSKTAALFNAAGIEIERVKAVSVDEPYVEDDTQPISWVKVYIHNGVGATSDSLKDHVVEVLDGYTDAGGVKIPGWKAAGVKVDVIKATEVTVNLAGLITPLPGYVLADLVTAADDVIGKHLLALDNEATLQLSDLVIKVGSLAGVANFVIQACDRAHMWGTSVSSLVLGTGAKTFVTQSGLGFDATKVVQAFRVAAPATRMFGTVTSYTGTSLVTNMLQQEGPAGTYTDWILALVDPEDVTAIVSEKIMPGTLTLAGA